MVPSCNDKCDTPAAEPPQLPQCFGRAAIVVMLDAIQARAGKGTARQNHGKAGPRQIQARAVNIDVWHGQHAANPARVHHPPHFPPALPRLGQVILFHFVAQFGRPFADASHFLREQAAGMRINHRDRFPVGKSLRASQCAHGGADPRIGLVAASYSQFFDARPQPRAYSRGTTQGSRHAGRRDSGLSGNVGKCGVRRIHATIALPQASRRQVRVGIFLAPNFSTMTSRETPKPASDNTPASAPANVLAKAPPEACRSLRMVEYQADLVVVGGGLAGACAAITAARLGLKVVLFQDRPVPGGNASSEVRLWILGATTHMGSNNRFAREGGVVNELVHDNFYRNPDCNALIFDAVLLEKIANEPNITLLLNTPVHECGKVAGDPDRIAWVRGFCSQNSTLYHAGAPRFLDASGDGILGFLAGAAFRMGAEKPEEFGEAFAPSGDFGGLLGHSIYFYSKDAGRPVSFTAPSFALRDIEGNIPRHRHFNATMNGCHLWWIEWGGRLDTVHDSEKIKWELWRVAYGVWDYIKNSGKFPAAASLTLEWFGHIPGKRESRRFEGPYMLAQNDVVRRPRHADAVAYGGWSIDLHPADGVFAPIAGAHHLHSKGPYQIPFRCLYSRNIKNLFLAGRIASSSHVAFGSTRVMATCALGGQAVAHAAALCRQFDCLPSDLSADARKIALLRRNLARDGQDQWGEAEPDPENLAQHARVTATSRLRLGALAAASVKNTSCHDKTNTILLGDRALAQLFHLSAGRVPELSLALFATAETTLRFELSTTSRPDHHTPDVLLGSLQRTLPPSDSGDARMVSLDFGVQLDAPASVFLVVYPSGKTAPSANAPVVRLQQLSCHRTGWVLLQYSREEKTSRVGGEDYPVYTSIRRPAGWPLALGFNPPLDIFEPGNVLDGHIRPMDRPHAWAADPSDPAPALTLCWDAPKTISRVDVFFDADYDHAMESVNWIHPDNVSPHCVKRWTLRDDTGRVLHVCNENHQAQNTVRLANPVTTRRLVIEVGEMNGPAPATIMDVRCYG